MTKEWCEEQAKQTIREIKDSTETLIKALDDIPDLTEKDRKKFERDIETGVFSIWGYVLPKHIFKSEEKYEDWKKKWNVSECQTVVTVSKYGNDPFPYHLLDSEVVQMKGDLIITDPCYLIKRDNEEDDWIKSNRGYNFEELGITEFVTHDTVYGDWSCGLFDADTKERLGSFCADASLVSVINLEQALKYNQEGVEEYIAKDWCAVIVKSFEGTAQIKVKEESGSCERDGEIVNYIDYEAYVELIGINTKTGKPVHLISAQTGL